MGDYSRKKLGNGLSITRKGSNLVLRETANRKDQNVQFCNRIGCNGRLNLNRGTDVSNFDKAKSLGTTFRSSSRGKEIIGSSSRLFASATNSRKSSLERQKKLPSLLEIDFSESGSVQDEPQVPEPVSPPGKIQQGAPESQSNRSFGSTSVETGDSDGTLTTRPRRNFHQKSVLGNSNNLTGSPVTLPSTSMHQQTHLNASKHGLRNIRCNSTSNIVTSGISSSESKLNRRKHLAKNRISDRDGSSSFRDKKISGSSPEGHNSSMSSGISFSESRRVRHGPANRVNGAPSVRTLSSPSRFQRARAGNQGSRNNLASNGSQAVIPQFSQSNISHDLNSPSSSRQFSVEAPLGQSVSSSQPGSSCGRFRSIRPSSPAEVNTRSLLNQESFRQYDMDRIAQVLCALDRIEQDEELTYELLVSPETNLFPSGLSFYDQHREMRLDIDNMTYEDLLALEERMGTVSTALTEEELSECLKTDVYQTEDSITNLDGDDNDVKCSICQEEYENRDEVGTLHCEHRYHVGCIHQWLRMKNWCPICKASAAAASPSSCSSPFS